MKKIFLIIILISLVLNIHGQTQNDTIMIEKFNFEAVEKQEFMIKKEDWIIDIYPPHGYSQWEFAPARDFYIIKKRYHPNGIISFKCKFLGNVPFGKREYYDKSGKLIESIDEDAKFEKIKPEDLVEIMEKVGWINRKTGEAITAEKPLPTDGTFYRTLFYLSYSRNLEILFESATYSEEGEKLTPSVWFFTYRDWHTQKQYAVNGDTGEYNYSEWDAYYND